MGHRARVAVIIVAALSSGAIISSAVAASSPRRADVKSLLKFETTFNQKMTAYLRSQKPESGFVSYRCMTDIALERFYQVAIKTNVPAAKRNECEIKTVEDGTKLRDAVLHYLDDVYAGKVSGPELDGVRKGRYLTSWFIQRVGAIKAP